MCRGSFWGPLRIANALRHELCTRGRARLKGLISYPGSVTIARAAGTLTFPARFTLLASMNPCPCGYRGVRGSDCRCDDAAVQRYLAKLSGPLLDRIDLHVSVSRVSFDDLVGQAPAETSTTIRARVESARDRQRARFAQSAVATCAALRGCERWRRD